MAASATATVGTKGIVRQVIGPVLDVEFPAGKLPKILNALRIEGSFPAGNSTSKTGPITWRTTPLVPTLEVAEAAIR